MPIRDGGPQRGRAVSLRDTILFIKTTKLTGEPVFMGLKFANGNLSATINKEYTYITDRGHLDDVRRGDDKPVNLSFEGKFTYHLSNANAEAPNDESATLHELLLGVELGNVVDHGRPVYNGTRENWLSAFGCPPYCCDIEVHMNPGLECPLSEAIGEALLYRYFRCESIAANFDTGAISVSGVAHINQPMAARVAAMQDQGAFGVAFTYEVESLAEPLDFVDDGFWQYDPRDLRHEYND